MKKFILIFLSSFLVCQMSLAQTSTSSGLIGFRRGLATVMFAGLGGAILGLSTLSFYGEPQEHVGNVWTGFAIGVLGGSAYVVAQSQKSTSSAMDLAAPLPPVAKRAPMLFQYSWEF
ncbi:MAG: hypothetical protein ACAH59_14075 [Pseudobdellovibrionaceae bacterium]